MITTTGRDLVTSTLRLIGVLASEETPSAADVRDCLFTANALIDGWGLQPLTMTTRARYVLDLVADQADYTVGLAGELPIAPPVRFAQINLIQATNTPPNEIPLQPLTYDAYQALLIKTLTSPLPTQWYFDRTTAAMATLSLWPTPTDSDLELALYTNVPTSQFDDADTVVELPWGYFKALRYTLALELAPEYGVTPRPDVTAIASDSLSRLKASNVVMVDLAVDLGLHNRRRGNYNILTDQP
jgi:hypothetical protein